MHFLISPRKARALAAEPVIEPRSALVALLVMLVISVLAIWAVSAALLNRPLEGLLNLAQLCAAAFVCHRIFEKLRPASVSRSDALKRLCLIVSSIATLWISIGAIFLSAAVILRVETRVLNIGMVIVDAIFFVGMLLHSTWCGSRVFLFMKGGTNEARTRT